MQTTLNQPPLQLKKYAFPLIQVEANPFYNPKRNSAPAFDISHHVDVDNISSAESGELLFQVGLTLKITSFSPNNENDKDGNGGPYNVLISVIGVFEVAPGWPKEKIDELLHITGASILWGAAREMISMITVRTPWPPFLLPAVSFKMQRETDFQEKAEEDANGRD